MAFSYYATITVDNTKVSGSSNLENFPVLISGTYDGTDGEPDLRTDANGGNILNTDASGGNSGGLTVPADLAFFSDAGLTTQLSHEIEYYDASTGQIEAWVKITADYDDDTVIYMVYGNTEETTSNEDINNVWSEYTAVYHMNNDPSGTVYDSCSDAKNLTTTGGTAFATADLVAGTTARAIDFERSKTQYMYVAAADNKFNITGNLTLEAVVNFDTLETQTDTLVMHGDGATYLQYALEGLVTNYPRFRNSASGNATSGDAISTGTWYYLAGIKTGTSGSVYQDSGTARTTDSSFNNPNSRTDELFIGYNDYAPNQMYLDGVYQECRITDAAHSEDWIQTTYNTIMSPSTFYAMGNETGGEPTPPVAGGAAPTIYMTTNTKFWGT